MSTGEPIDICQQVNLTFAWALPIFPSYGYPLIYWAFVQVGSWCWATRWYYIFPTESPVNIWWWYLVVCSVSVYWLWICVISANCRHRPLATDPGHVTCWDDTAQWSNLGVHKDITSTVFELQKWFLHQNGVEFCKKCNANDKSD